MKKYTVAMIGSGALGGIIARAIRGELKEHYELRGVLSGKVENASKLAEEVNCKVYHNLEELLADKPDYVIEAANPAVTKEMGLKILEKGINFIVLSAGAFADQTFYEAAKQAALENNCRVHIASGAVGGFDVLRSTLAMEKADVSIFTEKSPDSLAGAPLLEGRQLSPYVVEEVFSGTAEEAIEHFPQNINVAVATALATTGVENTNVVIRSVPGMTSNYHRIELSGATVKVKVEIDSKPSPDNPKSSSLAAWSVVALLRNLVSPITF